MAQENNFIGQDRPGSDQNRQGSRGGHTGGGDTDLPRDLQAYRAWHRQSLDEREEHWRREAGRIAWERDFTGVLSEDFASGRMDWFPGGTLRPLASAIDRHLPERAGQPAIVHLGADGSARRLSYGELGRITEVLAAAFRAAGLAQGDRVGLYLPPSLESAAFTLACARAGLTAVPLATALPAGQAAERLLDAGVSLLLVSGQNEPATYAEQRDLLLARLEDDTLRRVAVGGDGAPPAGTVPYREFIADAKIEEAPDAVLPADFPLFILYADTFAGRPRGGVFRAGGFLVQAACAYAQIFRGEPGRRILSTRSPASSVGQSLGLWAPLLRGDTVILPPWAEVLDTATLKRAQAEANPELLLSSPRLLAVLIGELGGAPVSEARHFDCVGCCGDPLSPSLRGRIAEALTGAPERVLNLWASQSSGTPLIASFPEVELNRPGALGLPLPGVDLRVLNESGEPCRSNESGQLVLAASTPGMVAEIWGQPERLRETYFERLPGSFHTGDTARVDDEGFVWFMGSLDDVVKMAGQSLSTGEIESLLAAHPRVAEVAVLGLRGGETDRLAAFVVPTQGETGAAAAALEEELKGYLEQNVGEIARPDALFVTRELPRTRTGKVVRRLLRRIASGEAGPDEDLSHLSNPEAARGLLDLSELASPPVDAPKDPATGEED